MDKIPYEVLVSTPLQPPPNNATHSNFVDPPSKDTEIYAVVSVILPLMVICLLMRLWTRIRIQKDWGADDYLIVISAACVGAYSAILILLYKGAMGEHGWDVPLIRLNIAFLQLQIASICMYGLCALFVRTTMLVLYLRIFRPSPQARMLIWGGIIFIIAFYISIGIAEVTLYFPGGKPIWKTDSMDFIPKMTLTLNSVQGVVGAVTDFYILFIPINLVLGLHLSNRQKLGVLGIFLTGFLACICSLLVTIYRFKGENSKDPLWESDLICLFAVVELNVGLICACLPVTLVLIKGLAKSPRFVSFAKKFGITITPSTKGGYQHGQTAENNSRSKLKNRLSSPKPVLTSLKSYIPKSHRSPNNPNDSDGSFVELGSISDDYHAHVKATMK